MDGEGENGGGRRGGLGGGLGGDGGMWLCVCYEEDRRRVGIYRCTVEVQFEFSPSQAHSNISRLYTASPVLVVWVVCGGSGTCTKQTKNEDARQETWPDAFVVVPTFVWRGRVFFPLVLRLACPSIKRRHFLLGTCIFTTSRLALPAWSVALLASFAHPPARFLFRVRSHTGTPCLRGETH